MTSSARVQRHEQGENMEMQGPTEVPQTEFLPGSFVIYAMHGKCHIISTETRTHSGVPILFYKLEVKNQLSPDQLSKNLQSGCRLLMLKIEGSAP